MADDSSAPASSFGQILKDAQEPKTDKVASPQEPSSTNPAQPISPVSEGSTSATLIEPESTSPIQQAPDLKVEEATPSATPIEPISETPTQATPTPVSAAPTPITEPDSISVDSSSTPSNDLGPPSGIPDNTIPPQNQPSLMPSEGPANVPGDLKTSEQKEEAVEPSSSPEPPQSHTATQTQMPISTETPKTSFGDLLGNQPAVEPTINIEPIEPSKASPPQAPLSPVSSQSPLSSPESSLDERLKQELDLRRQKANQVRIAKRQTMLDRLAALVKEKGKYTNTEAQEKFNLPQSTLGDYFQELVSRGVIKKFGKGRGMYYIA